MSNIQTGAERMPHDLSHLGFLAGQIGRLITISTTPVIAGDRKSGSAGMPRPISYAVFCLKKKKNQTPMSSSACPIELGEIITGGTDTPGVTWAGASAPYWG